MKKIDKLWNKSYFTHVSLRCLVKKLLALKMEIIFFRKGLVYAKFDPSFLYLSRVLRLNYKSALNKLSRRKRDTYSARLDLFLTVQGISRSIAIAQFLNR